MEIMPKRKGTNSLPFSKILRAIMKDRGLTLRAVAEMSGVNTSVVQNWLTGSNPHDLAAIARLSDALGVGFRSLLLGTDEKHSKILNLAEIYDERAVVDGLCKVKIVELVHRSQNGGDP